MKTIYASLVKGSGLGKGLGSRLAALVVAVCFVSAIGSKALAQSASMTQLEFLQYMVQLSGESLGKSAKPADYALWARGKGMQPDAGWQLSAKLSRDVLAKSLVQYLGLNPRKKSARRSITLCQSISRRLTRIWAFLRAPAPRPSSPPA